MKDVTAALLVIGDEILSGRTSDKNINYLANHCTAVGIRLEEVRVVSDKEDRIVDALNVLRSSYDYVFTTGGIGPTHDDITAQSVAKAVGVELFENRQAIEIMQARYPGEELSEGRRLMARIPDGGELIKNSVSGAPGFMIENVIVMAGVPKIMQVMLDDVTPKLRTGRRLLSRTFIIRHPESTVARLIGKLDDENEGISLGSYPYFKLGKVGSVIVFRGVDEEQLDQVCLEFVAELKLEEKDFEEDCDSTELKPLSFD
jgi:molybdenum cofactor synthesis domain-containing protein